MKKIIKIWRIITSYDPPSSSTPTFFAVTSTREKHSRKQFYSTQDRIKGRFQYSYLTQQLIHPIDRKQTTNKISPRPPIQCVSCNTRLSIKRIHSTTNSSSHSNNIHLQLHLTPALFDIIQH